MTQNKPKLYVAIDTVDIDFAKQIVHELVLANKSVIDGIKIGLEFFLSFGKPGLLELYPKDVPNLDLFLDLKLYDIPHTVVGALRALSDLPLTYVSVHGSGSNEMLSDASNFLKDNMKNTKLVSVTRLTSADDRMDASGEIFALARNSVLCGIPSITCSARYAKIVKDHIHDLTIITPGIRPTFYEAKDDQKQICTPTHAVQNKSDILVVGRPITDTKSKYSMRERAEMIKKEIENA